MKREILGGACAAFLIAAASPALACCIGPPPSVGEAAGAIDADGGPVARFSAQDLQVTLQDFESGVRAAVQRGKVSATDANVALRASAEVRTEAAALEQAGRLDQGALGALIDRVRGYYNRVWVRPGYF